MNTSSAAEKMAFAAKASQKRTFTESSSAKPAVGKTYWHLQLRDPDDALFSSRSARFAFLNIWRIYVASCYPTCAYVLIPGYFGCIIETPEGKDDAAISASLCARLKTKIAGLVPAAALADLEQRLRLRRLDSVKECMYCTFDLHTLPQRYHISTDYRSYPFSSYRALSVGASTAVKHQTVFDWFGGQLRFSVFHQAYYGWVKPEHQPEPESRHVAGF